MWNDWRPGLFALLPARGMNLELMWATVALVGAVLIGVVVIVWVDRWRKRSLADMQAPADELGHYRELFDQGLLSAEEYERICRRLEQRPAAKPDEHIRAGPEPGTGGKADAIQTLPSASAPVAAPDPPKDSPPAGPGPH
jgi:hypothetical protein